MKLRTLTPWCWIAVNADGLERAVRLNPRTLEFTIVAGFSEIDAKRAINMASHFWSAR